MQIFTNLLERALGQQSKCRALNVPLLSPISKKETKSFRDLCQKLTEQNNILIDCLVKSQEAAEDRADLEMSAQLKQKISELRDEIEASLAEKDEVIRIYRSKEEKLATELYTYKQRDVALKSANEEISRQLHAAQTELALAKQKLENDSNTLKQKLQTDLNAMREQIELKE